MAASGAKWLLTSTYLRADDADRKQGYVLASGETAWEALNSTGHRTNLLRPPYCARDPLRLYLDAHPDQYLGLWDLDEGPILSDC